MANAYQGGTYVRGPDGVLYRVHAGRSTEVVDGGVETSHVARPEPRGDFAVGDHASGRFAIEPGDDHAAGRFAIEAGDHASGRFAIEPGHT